MSNTINLIEQLAREKRLGWPNGTTHLYKAVELLFNRLEQLERVTASMARAHIIEQQIPTGSKVLTVNADDCKRAFDLLDRSQSVDIPIDTFFDMPAES